MILYKSHKSLCSTYTYLHHASTEIQREERDIWVLCVCVRRESRMGFLLLLEQKGNVYKKMQPHTKSLMGFLLGEKGRKEKKWNIIKTTGLYWIHPVSLSLSLSISSMQTNNNKKRRRRRRRSPIFVPSGRPQNSFESLLVPHTSLPTLFLSARFCCSCESGGGREQLNRCTSLLLDGTPLHGI